MTVPLVLLAAGTVVIGVAVGIPPEGGPVAGWLDPVFEAAIALAPHSAAGYELFGVDGVLVLLPVGVASIGIAMAWRLFGVELRPLGLRRAPDPLAVEAIVRRDALSSFIYRASLNKWWFDDLNHLLFIRIQTGRVQNYALGIAIGLIAMAGGYLLITAR